MKKILLLMGILVSFTAAREVADQITEGVIIYEVKVNAHRTLPPDRQEMKNVIPEFRTNREQLIFNANESLHKMLEEEEDEDIDAGNGMRMTFRTPQNEFYMNQTTSRTVRLQEFMGKKYIMEDSVRITPWKLVSETKEIKGYLCKKATLFDEKRQEKIVAWYTDKLRPFLGPDGFNSLPGGVLQVDINDGERTITALSIEARPLKKNELKMSGGGIKTTEAEFRKIRDEHIQRMRANGANVIIRD